MVQNPSSELHLQPSQDHVPTHEDRNKHAESQHFSLGQHSVFASSPIWPQPYGQMHGVGTIDFEICGFSCGLLNAYHNVVLHGDAGNNERTILSGGYGCGVA